MNATKILVSLLGSALCLVATSGCEVYATGEYPVYNAPSYTTPIYNGISSIATQGVDDRGNMVVDLYGDFSSWGSTVDVFCDGANMPVAFITQNSPSDIIIAIPASSFYNRCDFTVTTDNQILPTVSASLTAMDFTHSSLVLESDPRFLELKLFGDFFVGSLYYSSIAVIGTCDGGHTYFRPPVLFLSGTEIDVELSNPGPGYTDSCQFTVEDTFNDSLGRAITISSPTLSKNICGI